MGEGLLGKRNPGRKVHMRLALRVFPDPKRKDLKTTHGPTCTRWDLGGWDGWEECTPQVVLWSEEMLHDKCARKRFACVY